MTLEDYRQQMDQADEALVRAFCQRMETAASIAAYKKEHGLPVLDSARERDKLRAVAEQAGPDLADYTTALYSLLFELSRASQGRLLGERSPLSEEIARAIAETPPLFPPRAQVACQGVEGAYSQLACERLFKTPSISYFSSFDAVFSAIEHGFCRYGVIPLENSTAGSVNRVYDLMADHRFYIVRSVRVKVDHCLAARPGAKLEGIREIVSHDQAIRQCASFLEGLKGVELTRCENTAAAARLVAESGRDDIAALCARPCLELYGLDCLQGSVQDRQNNYTRFICIAKDLQILEGVNKVSILFRVPHRPGSLYEVLSTFATVGVNVSKLESRPIPGHDFDFLFYADVDADCREEQTVKMLCDLTRCTEEMTFQGACSEA